MAEKMLGLLPVVKKPKSFGRWDTYAVIITDERAIFAQLTSDMLKEAAKEAQRQGKEEGKGFFARWADQLRATMSYSERYWDIPPDEALNENPGNFAIPNDDIKKINIKQKTQSGWGDDADQYITELKIEARGRKDTYNVDSFSNEMKEMLKSIYGDRLK